MLTREMGTGSGFWGTFYFVDREEWHFRNETVFKEITGDYVKDQPDK